jgi:hypothetical protein
MYQEVSIVQQSFHLVGKQEYSQEFALVEKLQQENRVGAFHSDSYA